MAGESWKSHKNSALERDMDADHQAQRREYEPRVASTQEIVQEIRDGSARDVDSAVARVRQEAMADWARSTAQTLDLDQSVEADSVERLRARMDDLLRDRQADPILSDWTSTDADEYEEDLRVAQQPAVAYVPPPVDPQYRQDADYPSAVVANTRVVPAEAVDPWAPRPAADTARFQTELAIAQQVAGNQLRAQQQADAEAAERVASAALGQYIAPTTAAPAQAPHR